LIWAAPAGKWSVHGLVSKHGIQKVKRSAPGGAGWVLDPFSKKSMGSYLHGFDSALYRAEVPEPRAHFHDSFEYYGAAWTDDLFARFQELRGYDLRSQLPAFHGEGDPDSVARVRADYRETMSDLHREYLAAWHDWAKERGSLTRNQAHGSPGNLLDHYSVADIPETEIFRHVDENQIPMLQFASSAAHLTGRNLVSAETFTWLDEHFQVTPAKLKEAADFVWLGGVNHILFHGIPYSPQDAGWPGWLFYASTHMGPNGGLWRDLPAFNAYIARCQTVLQSGKPDAEVLLYFPIHDLWHDGAEGLPLFTVHNQDKWLHPTPFYRTAKTLWNAGIPCDFVSDRLLEKAQAQDGRILLGGVAYKTIVIPSVEHMPPETAIKLRDLGRRGARISFIGSFPEKIPGFINTGDSNEDTARRFHEIPEESIIMSGNPLAIADRCGIVPEVDLARLGIPFVRRAMPDGCYYFLVNRSGKAIDARVKLAAAGKGAVMMDPWTGQSGVVDQPDSIRLVLHPGASRIVRIYRGRQAEGPKWVDLEAEGQPVTLAGTWSVRFLDGGPELPPPFQTKTLGSWTAQEGDSYRNFSGTALYQLEFDWSGRSSVLLDLGEVCHTASIRLNGGAVGTTWSPPHRMLVELKRGRNVLEIEVTSLAANRIADLDRRKVAWKAFHEINFVNIDYKPFDASAWDPLPSGLLGPVSLVPLK
jgi:hypothetical protein